jgi:hypothetical protein
VSTSADRTATTAPRRLSLLYHASPPSSPPPAAGLIDTLAGHRSSAAALERRHARPFSLPHHRWPSPVRTRPPHLARRNHCRSPVSPHLARHPLCHCAASKILYCLEKYEANFYVLLKSISTHRNYLYSLLLSKALYKISRSKTLGYFSRNIYACSYSEFMHTCSCQGQ